MRSDLVFKTFFFENSRKLQNLIFFNHLALMVVYYIEVFLKSLKIIKINFWVF